MGISDENMINTSLAIFARCLQRCTAGKIQMTVRGTQIGQLCLERCITIISFLIYFYVSFIIQSTRNGVYASIFVFIGQEPRFGQKYSENTIMEMVCTEFQLV